MWWLGRTFNRKTSLFMKGCSNTESFECLMNAFTLYCLFFLTYIVQTCPKTLYPNSFHLKLHQDSSLFSFLFSYCETFYHIIVPSSVLSIFSHRKAGTRRIYISTNAHTSSVPVCTSLCSSYLLFVCTQQVYTQRLTPAPFCLV